MTPRGYIKTIWSLNNMIFQSPNKNKKKYCFGQYLAAHAFYFNFVLKEKKTSLLLATLTLVRCQCTKFPPGFIFVFYISSKQTSQPNSNCFYCPTNYPQLNIINKKPSDEQIFYFIWLENINSDLCSFFE